MQHQDQVEQGRKLLAYKAARTTALADAIYRHNVSDYTCPGQAAKEREIFFGRWPISIGLSGLLPNPGDYLTHDHTGKPLLLVRQQDGSLRGFMNVCRHRGARVAEGQGNRKAGFTCPYHGWTYGLGGDLAARPEERAFEGMPRAGHGLVPIPVLERDGLIWACPTPGADLDLGPVLGGAERDLAGYRLAGYHHYETRTLRQRINWKGVVDTFLEIYHIGALHTKTIYPILHSNLATFDAFGPSLRLIGARRTIDQMAARPEAEWDLITHSVMIYVLFPNTVFIMQGDHVETWHVFPAGNGIDESVMYISLYTPEPAVTESARRHWDRNFDLLMATVEGEDFPVGEGIQRSYHSGAQDHVVFGRNEPGLQHYHAAIKRALGLTPAGGTENASREAALAGL